MSLGVGNGIDKRANGGEVAAERFGEAASCSTLTDIANTSKLQLSF